MLAQMAHAGDVLENPATGDRLVFLKTAADTGGEALEYEIDFVPRGFAVRDHLHPRQEERHEVLEGTLGIVTGGRERRLGAGDVEVVPPRTQHRLFAVDGGRVRARFTSRPALESEVLLETLFGLARDGKVGASGDPGLLQLAVIFRDFAELGHPTRPALGVQRAIFAPLATLGRLRGYRARYERYSGGEAARDGEYVFVDEWDVDAPIEAVFDALADATTYPDWWKPVYIDVEAEGEPRVGQVSRQHFKGRLPYHLHTSSEITRLERPTAVGADVTGDLAGRGLWTLTAANGGTHVRFDWRVLADRPLLRTLTPVLRPVFRWNHNWAIARAMEGLEPYARRTSQ
jgi:uncharacterized protein YndB with AHSA1/START domain/mannose-6-phosphate isomerase-like protein (cupin superfamily)